MQCMLSFLKFKTLFFNACCLFWNPNILPFLMDVVFSAIQDSLLCMLSFLQSKSLVCSADCLFCNPNCLLCHVNGLFCNLYFLFCYANSLFFVIVHISPLLWQMQNISSKSWRVLLLLSLRQEWIYICVCLLLGCTVRK